MASEGHPLEQTPPLYLTDRRFLLTCSDDVVSPQEKETHKRFLLEEIEKKGFLFCFFFFQNKVGDIVHFSSSLSMIERESLS